MSSALTICFIGGGNMAAAMIGGWLARGHSSASLRVIDPGAAAREKLAAQFAGIGCFATFTADAIKCADLIVLAVKPQQMREVAGALTGQLTQQTVLSVAAGIRVSDLSRWLGGYSNVVRAMPNTPALVHAGITGLYASTDAPAAAKRAAEALMRAVGEVLWFDAERALDAVTGVSGSGPAYVFLCIEALETAAIAQGIEPLAARQLALATFAGAAKLAAASTDSPAVLRANVTSKGGTTERGVAALAAMGVPTAFAQAVADATARSIEMGDALGAQ